MDRPLPQITLKERRDRTVAQLCDAFAQDHLELTEFESRLDEAHRAATAGDLDKLVADLPAIPAPAPATTPSETLARGADIVRKTVRESQTLLAIMGGVERRGTWTPARRNLVIAIMGGAELDFRTVALPPGETEVYVFAMMGGVEIVVPPGLNVDASGIAIMGGFEHASTHYASDPNAPTLRIGGFCIMGGVDISVRHPGETPKDARQREREERHRLRDAQRRLRGRE